MSLPDEDLLLISDVANRLGKSDQYVHTKLRQRKFQRVIIEYLAKSGGQWTSHLYFDKAVWPFRGKATRQEKGGDYHHLLDPKDPNESWLQDARNIFIPASAVEAFVQENDSYSKKPNASSPSINASQLDLSKMSLNLRIAIQADAYLYSQGKILTKRGHRAQIDAWLQQQHPDLTKNARDIIIAVVNRKKGGPPRNDKK